MADAIDPISRLAGIDPSYAERLHNDHVRMPCCAECDELRAENKRLRAALKTLANAKDWHPEDMWRYAQSILDE